MWRPTIIAIILFLAQNALAVPAGYRYIGGRVVSEGRHVYWYWNTDLVEIGTDGSSFIARMYARNLELDQERSYAAIIRCDARTYRQLDSHEAFETIEEGDPIFAVWRTGCDGKRAVPLATRNERLNGASVAASARPEVVVAATPVPVEKKNVGVPALPPPATATPDPRRVDQCVRFREGAPSQFGDGQIVNTCAFNVELVLCYKGGRGGAYDCPATPKAMKSDSLAPGALHKLPEYKRGSNTGIVVVACKGTMGSVFPMLDGAGGKHGCF
jgi:hypothetical protein